jgi:bifunctional non-homologous end joining protein LigD
VKVRQKLRRVYTSAATASDTPLFSSTHLIFDCDAVYNAPMSLEEYKKKRKFSATPEPAPKKAAAKSSEDLIFVVQKHAATRLHYDFRLEWKGVLLSWAVPKGPSPDPSVKRLAMPTEDHPIEYADFEGVIPEGEYGGGTVMVWDNGTWTAESPDVDEALKKGDLKFSLHGKKLKGSWVLVRTGGFGGRPGWLLIKHRDKFASTKDLTVEEPKSVISKQLLAQIAEKGGGNVEKAAAADKGTTLSAPASAAAAKPARKSKSALKKRK